MDQFVTLENEYVSFQIFSNDDKAATLSSIGNDRGYRSMYPDRSEYNFQPRVNRDNKHTLALPSGIEGQLYSFASLVTTIRATEGMDQSLAHIIISRRHK